MARILCIGDSITWGAYDLEMGGWVSRLRHALDAEDVEDMDNGRGVYNLGIGGDKVSDALARFDAEVQARDKYGIETIILALGANDSPHDTNPEGTDLKLFEAQFRELISKAQAAVPNVVIVGPANIDDEHPQSWEFRNAAIRPYRKIIEKVAQENNLCFVPLFGLIEKDHFEFDGVHPNAAGHEKIFRKVKEALDALNA